ncbi:MAG: TonB-dependent receptor plug domain-containing protein [Bacteroidia bacterium]|nr:TonB-dependent receptor plug domain-containing protein [Bacteroidia bacterium]MCZ2249070.1 TonB-dependent receptor [Bacteroidia bacterium]
MRVFIILLSLFALQVKAQYSIQGKVISAENDFKIYDGIYAELFPGNKYAEIINGTFKFEQLKKGVYRLQIQAIGFEKYNQNFSLNNDTTITLILKPSVKFKDEVVIYGTKNLANFTSVQSLSKPQIEENNFGQDVPYLLQNFTSVNVSSDAGAGVGYTNMSVRGSDATRINVTMNGIPLNDAESHGAFWVNIPDFLSSAESISLQKGIGASTNGVAAFGANLNIQTNTLNAEPYAEINNSYGSFNTLKNTIKVGTGLLNEHFTADIRLSNISSDGYIDRAFSNLKSYFVSAGWYGKHSIIKFNQFTGKEKTYQAWNGVPQDTLKTNRTYNEFTYKNQTDNYTQIHHQLNYSYTKRNILINAGMHYTQGQGYYEEYKKNASLAKYNLDNLYIGNDTITNTDLVRRRWLDNDFYGTLYSITFNPDFSSEKRIKTKVVVGGAANQYLGNHFGDIIWSQYASNSFIGDKYYDDDAYKTDINQYFKLDVYLPQAWSLFTDLQYRYIDYRFTGFNDLLRPTPQDAQYQFFNPKLGYMKLQTYQQQEGKYIPTGYKTYGFFGFSHREPVRVDFTNSSTNSRPKPEKMYNAELGYEKIFANKINLKFNYYLQYYIDQLVLTGQINDVGAYTRTNVDKSYRSGFEIESEIYILKNLKFFTGTTISKNKIASFTEYIDDYDLGNQQTQNYKNTDIAFSPNVISSEGVEYRYKNSQITLTHKYVGKQYLDNTQNSTKMINSYNYANLQIAHTFKAVRFKSITIGLMINNIFNTLYESNGYTYSYIYNQELIKENFYFPQAGINYMFNCSIKF